MSGGDEDGAQDRPFHRKAGCLLFVGLCAIGNLAAVIGAGAYVQYTVTNASRWTDFFSPSFWWEYARTPLGATLWIVVATTGLVAFALLEIWKRRAR